MSRHRVDLQTPDGVLDCYVFEPAGVGPWPAVVLYMDAFGIRDDLDVMAARLAGAGYVVAVPNLYHRSGAFAPFDPALVAAGGAERDRFMGMIKSINGDLVMQDTAAVLAHLATRPSVRAGHIGTVGYCMGGGYALRAAGIFPDRIAAAASFHGGSLATDRPDSPHQLASQMRARLYVGVAGIDPGFTDEQRRRLDKALRDGGVDYEIEIYDGAQHGFAVHNHRVYDRAASERHWERLLELFDGALHGGARGISLAPRREPERFLDEEDRMTSARIATLIVACGLATTSAALAGPAQRGRGPAVPSCATLACDVQGDWERTKNLLLGLVNAMPDDKWSFKPTPAQQTFAERVMHVAQIDIALFGTLGGKTPAPTIANPKATTKAEVIAALQASFDYGAAVLKEFTDQQLTERIASMPFLGPSASRLKVIYFSMQHTNDIYGQLVVYLRMNGVTPPASNRA